MFSDSASKKCQDAASHSSSIGFILASGLDLNFEKMRWFVLPDGPELIIEAISLKFGLAC